jgi:hypothetical protein
MRDCLEIGTKKKANAGIETQSSSPVFPKLCVATSWGRAELRQGRRKKTRKTEKKKLIQFLFFFIF